MDKYGADLQFRGVQPGSGGGVGTMGGSSAEAVAAMRDPVAASAGSEASRALASARMRCGGCGSKVPATGEQQCRA
jgi:hypothetical protein